MYIVIIGKLVKAPAPANLGAELVIIVFPFHYNKLLFLEINKIEIFLVQVSQLSTQKMLYFLSKQRKWRIIINFQPRDENILTGLTFLSQPVVL